MAASRFHREVLGLKALPPSRPLLAAPPSSPGSLLQRGPYPGLQPFRANVLPPGLPPPLPRPPLALSQPCSPPGLPPAPPSWLRAQLCPVVGPLEPAGTGCVRPGAAPASPHRGPAAAPLPAPGHGHLPTSIPHFYGKGVWKSRLKKARTPFWWCPWSGQLEAGPRLLCAARLQRGRGLSRAQSDFLKMTWLPTPS